MHAKAIFELRELNDFCSVKFSLVMRIPLSTDSSFRWFYCYNARNLFLSHHGFFEESRT